jgi:hypothetical protein
MSPLALIPIGLCAFIATFCAESTIKNQLGNSFKPTSKVMLKESFTLFEVQRSIMAGLSNMPAPASSAEYSDLVVRVAITKCCISNETKRSINRFKNPMLSRLQRSLESLQTILRKT